MSERKSAYAVMRQTCKYRLGTIVDLHAICETRKAAKDEADKRNKTATQYEYYVVNRPYIR